VYFTFTSVPPKVYSQLVSCLFVPCQLISKSSLFQISSSPGQLVPKTYLTISPNPNSNPCLNSNLNLNLNELTWRRIDLGPYSQKVVGQLSYVRQSYDVDMIPLPIRNAGHTYDCRKFHRKSTTYLHMSYDHHCRPLCWLLSTLMYINTLLT